MSLSMFYACLAFPAGRESFRADLTWNLSPKNMPMSQSTSVTTHRLWRRNSWMQNICPELK